MTPMKAIRAKCIDCCGGNIYEPRFCTAKTPEDMFPLEIPNDLKYVDDTIRDYYGLTKEDK